MRRAIETVFRDPELTLRWLPGSTPRLVVVFTGMKRGFGGAAMDEFAASASCRGENGVLFVTDRRVTWFSAPGLWKRTVDLIRTVRDSEGAREVVSLGNSMGGYAAMLLARDMRLRRVIAFSPQVTMDRDILADDRWPDVKARWGRLPVRDLSQTVAASGARYYVVAGRDCAEDMAHVHLLPEGDRMNRFLLPTSRHNPAGALKEAGLLHRVVAAMVRGRKTRATALLDGWEAAA